jgi:hypothetical protein
MLSSNKLIPEDPFFEEVGHFSKELKLILSTYFESPPKKQDELRPFINYYRQLQNYLVFILRFPTILLVPHHSEIQQTLEFIHSKKKLIETLYHQISEEEKKLLCGEFKENLEKFFNQKMKNE